MSRIQESVSRLSLTPPEAQRAGLKVNSDGKRRTALELLAYPSIAWADLVRVWPELAGIPDSLSEQVETEALYAGYLDRQQADIVAFQKDERIRIPDDFDYASVGGLSNEAREKLAAARPATLGQAGRIEGVTPGALTAVLASLKSGARKAG